MYDNYNACRMYDNCAKGECQYRRLPRDRLKGEDMANHDIKDAVRDIECPVFESPAFTTPPTERR